MSRIGSKTIAVPAGVKVTVADAAVVVEGKLGKLNIELPEGINVAVENDTVAVTRTGDQYKALHGLVRSLINNAVIGVLNGYRKELLIVGVGYKATLAGNKLTLNLGYSHTIEYIVPEGIKMTITDGTKITIDGYDKQLVGEVAASIRRFKKPEPSRAKACVMRMNTL